MHTSGHMGSVQLKNMASTSTEGSTDGSDSDVAVNQYVNIPRKRQYHSANQSVGPSVLNEEQSVKRKKQYKQSRVYSFRPRQDNNPPPKNPTPTISLTEFQKLVKEKTRFKRRILELRKLIKAQKKTIAANELQKQLKTNEKSMMTDVSSTADNSHPLEIATNTIRNTLEPQIADVAKTVTDLNSRLLLIEKRLPTERESCYKRKSWIERGWPSREPYSVGLKFEIQPTAAARGMNYNVVLRKARETINLTSLSITSLRYRHTVAGARLLEMLGDYNGNTSKMEALAQELRTCFNQNEVIIARTVQTSEVCLMGLDDSITPQEIIKAIARIGECPEQLVSTNGKRVSKFGELTVRVKCPITAAIKAYRAHRIVIGWMSVKVIPLPHRPPRCFRCWRVGHSCHICPFRVNYLHICRRCCYSGHKAANCTGIPYCLTCEEVNWPTNHSVGAMGCVANFPHFLRR